MAGKVKKTKRASAKSPAYKLVEYVWQNSNTTAWVGMPVTGSTR